MIKKVSAQVSRTGASEPSPANETDIGLARLAAIVESSSDAIIGKDLRGIVTSWNLSAEMVFGYTAAEMIGQPIARLIPMDRQAEEVEILRRIGAGETIKSFNTLRTRKDGTTIPISATISPIKDAAGKIIGGSKIARDISEYKKAEQQLQDGKKQLDFALDAAELGQWSLNLADHTAHRTLRHDQIFGYDSLLPEWTYETFLHHVVPDERAAVDAGFQKAVATGSAWVVECRIRRADGAVRHIWTKALIRRDADGQVHWMLGIVGDVTERRQAEARQAYLVRLADTLRPLSDAIDVQAKASQLLGEHLGANRVVYFEIRGDDYVIERDYSAGVRSLVGRYPVAAFGPAELTALLEGRTVIEADATTEPDRPPGERAAFAAIQVRGHVDVPLVRDGRFVAGMTVQVSDRRDWTRHEVALIEDTAERTWAAVGRVRAESALRTSEEGRRLALDAAELGAFNIDPTTNALTTNERFRTILAGTTEAMDYEQAFAAIHPEDRGRIRAAIAAATRSDDPVPYAEEYRVVHSDGSVHWVFAKGRANYDREGAGRLVSFDGTIVDVTARKGAEAALQQSEERFAFVRQSSGVGFWYCDLPFDVLQWDDLVKAHFHMPPEATVTIRTFYDRIHPDDREPTRLAIERSITEKTPYNTDYRTVNPDTGAVKWVRAIGRTFYAADDTPTRFDGVTLDVSDQKQAEHELRQLATQLRDADRRKDEFLATLAHELRNPLAPILNGLHVIRMVGAHGTIEQARSMMERQVTQLVRLVDDLLDVNRVTTGKVTLNTDHLALREVIDAALETSRPVIAQAGHKLSVVIPEDPIIVEGDLMRLAQVVANLLTNSAKYTHPGGHLRMSVAREGNVAIVSVADDGIGIPPAMLEKVFNMFTQVDRALEKTTGGLGIGLSLVKGLVELHGGTIEARSEGEGLGSEFVVRLPVASSAVNEVAQQAAVEHVHSHIRRRILVVDDNLDSAESLGILLELLGHQVSIANDGLQAVDLAESFQPDLTLLDIGMPKLNGYEAARLIRANAWGQGTVLVALTGWGQEDDRKKSSDAGFDHHLVKPVDIDVLTKLLDGLPT